jgi:hypothetical protein
MKNFNYIIIAILLAFIVRNLMFKSEKFRNYVNLGSLTNEFNITNPQRRVSEPFLHRAPGE